MPRYLEILGQSFPVPDPDSIASLAASFRAVCTNVGDAESQLSALGSPQAWGEWTGQAADAFARSLGQLPKQLGQAWQSYNTVTWALSEYAAGLGPVVAALGSLAIEAEDAEGTLRGTTIARNQAIAQGQNPRITGWDARLDDARAAVDAIGPRLFSLREDMDGLSAQCASRIRQAQHEGIQNTLITDFDRYVLPDGAVVLRDSATALGVAASVLYDTFVAPFADLQSDFSKFLADPSLHTMGVALEDVSAVLGLVALVAMAAVPGADLIGAPALAAYLGTGAEAVGDVGMAVSIDSVVVNTVAVAGHEPDATGSDVAWSALSLGLDGVGVLVGDGAPGIVYGVGTGIDTTLLQDGLQHAVSLPNLAAPGGPDVLDGLQVMPGAASALQGLPSAGTALQPGAGASVLQPAGSSAGYSPAVVTLQHVTYGLQPASGPGTVPDDPAVSQGMGM